MPYKDKELWKKGIDTQFNADSAVTAGIGVIGSSLVITDVNWYVVLSASILAGILSLLTSLAGLPEIKEPQS